MYYKDYTNWFQFSNTDGKETVIGEDPQIVYGALELLEDINNLRAELNIPLMARATFGKLLNAMRIEPRYGLLKINEVERIILSEHLKIKQEITKKADARLEYERNQEQKYCGNLK